MHGIQIFDQLKLEKQTVRFTTLFYLNLNLEGNFIINTKAEYFDESTDRLVLSKLPISKSSHHNSENFMTSLSFMLRYYLRDWISFYR